MTKAKSAARQKRYWLLKTEPDTFSISDLERAPKQTTCWDGVRNYQARNLLRDEVSVGDEIFIYHSRTQPLAIVGTAQVTRAGYPDPSQFDATSPYADPRSTQEAPRWYAIDVQWRRTFAAPVARDTLAQQPALADLMLLRRGSRLSVQPVDAQAWGLILTLSRG